jgi:hypothetical protein
MWVAFFFLCPAAGAACRALAWSPPHGRPLLYDWLIAGRQNMKTLLAILAAIFGLVHSFYVGIVDRFNQQPTNWSVFMLILFAGWLLERSLERRINGLRNLLGDIEDRRRGNWS